MTNLSRIVCLAALVLLVVSKCAAQGDYYAITSVAGGTYTRGGTQLPDYNTPPGLYGGGSTAVAPGTASCQGDITFTFTWQSTDTNYPKYVVVAKSCVAQATGVASATADDGLGDTEVITLSNGTITETSQGTHYTLLANPGQQFPVTIHGPNSSAIGGSVPGGGVLVGTAGVLATVSETPVTIGFSWGAILDSSGNWDCLVGQGVGAVLNSPVPATYWWTGVNGEDVKGEVWGSGSPFYTQHLWQLNFDDADLASNPFGFYTPGGPQSSSDIATQSITCNATLYDPVSPYESLGDVTLSEDLRVFAPQYDLTGTPGTGNFQGYNGGITYSSGDLSGVPGMSFTFFADTPALFANTEGSGYFSTSQEIYDVWSYSINGNPYTLEPPNNYWRCDTTYTYPSDDWQASSTNYQSTNDTPSVTVPAGPIYFTPDEPFSIQTTYDFRMQLAYFPPGPAVSTSIRGCYWEWSAAASNGSGGGTWSESGNPAVQNFQNDDWLNFSWVGIRSAGEIP